MKDTTLVIMAAGVGSRFGGGIKQLEPIGPGGEIIMDYSIHDALEAGFNKVVFIIRKDLEADFREVIGNRIEKITNVEYVFQEVDSLPEGYKAPEGRKKPWGTGHAVLTVKGVVNEPFVVINADDYYGKEGFRKIHDYMVSEMDTDSDYIQMCMAGFILSNTLSENGTVTRGVCVLNEDDTLKSVAETYGLRMNGDKVEACDVDGNSLHVMSDQHVSMNMWGLPPKFLDELEKEFIPFLDGVGENGAKAEFLLPAVINGVVESGRGQVKVLETQDKWFGVTYKEDKEAVVAAIRKLIADGVYKEKLYE